MSLYRVSCGHQGCNWNAQVDIESDAPITDWEPPHHSEVLDPNGEPLIVPWVGQPLDDAYGTHYQQVHAGTKQPPMCVWCKVG